MNLDKIKDDPNQGPSLARGQFPIPNEEIRTLYELATLNLICKQK